MQPKVRTLDQLVAESNPAYNPQRTAYNQQIQGANARLGEQQQGLDAAKTNAFGDITQAAVRRGALFGGFTPDQQARYTAEKYLPALANLRAANEQTIQGLTSNIMGLDSEQRKQALSTREGDLSRLYDYNSKQEDRKFQTDQANQAYEREMAKLRQEQAFTASQNAQNRATTQQSQPTAAQNMGAALTAKAAEDGFVSHGTWSSLKNQWISGGYGNAKQFDQAFAGYRNPRDTGYRLG